jgi:hypothetical protein
MVTGVLHFVEMKHAKEEVAGRREERIAKKRLMSNYA